LKPVPIPAPSARAVRAASSAGRTGRLLLLLILFWIPLAFVPGGIPWQNTTSVFLKDIAFLLLCPPILLLAVVMLGWGRLSRTPERSSPLLAPGLLLAAWIALLLWRSPYPAAAFQEAHRWFCYLALAYAASLLLRSSSIQQKAWSLTLLTSALVSVHAILQFLDYDLFPWGDFPWALPLRRVCSSLGNPNFLGGYLVATLPLTVAALARRRRMGGRGAAIAGLIAQALLVTVCIAHSGSSSIERLAARWGASNLNSLRPFLVLAQVIVLAAPGLLYFSRAKRFYPVFLILYFQLMALVLTFSLGSLAGVIAALFLMALLFVLSKLHREGLGRSSKNALAALLAVFAVALFLAYPAGRLVAHYRKATVLERREMYRGTVQMIAERPLSGFGPGMFSVFFPDYRPTQLAIYIPPGEYFVDHGHSEFLELASEFGLVGLGLYLWMILSAVWPAVIRCRRERPVALWWLRAALAGALTGTLAQNLISVNLRQISTACFFWLSLGWLAALLPRPTSPRLPFITRFPALRRWLLRGAVVLLFVLAVANTVVVGKEYVGDLLLTRGIAISNRIEEATVPEARQYYYRHALYDYDKALQLIPHRTQGHYFLAALKFSFDDYEGALESYRKVFDLERHFVDVDFNIATTLVKLHRYDEALALYEQSLEEDPKNARLHDYYARTLYLTGRPQEAAPVRRRAIELFHDKLRLYPHDARLYHDLGKNYMFDEQWDKARDYLWRAVKADPRNPVFQQSWREYQALRALQSPQGKPRERR